MSQPQMRDDHPVRLLGVFAHPDDEIFCAGGTLAQWSDAGNETMVVSATRGEAGQIQDAIAATRQTLGAVRERELRAACALLGVARVECLDYRDGMLAEVDQAQLASDVAAIIREYQPDVVVTFGQDGGYGHPDHIAISLATKRACELISRENGWAPQLYYSAFPKHHTLMCESLAQWLVSRDTAFRGSTEFVRALALLAEESATMGYADDAVQVQWFPAGFSIVEQGERATSLHLIISGHVKVIAEGGEEMLRVDQTLGPGQFFGAEALFARRAHATSCVATDTVTCLVISRQAPTAFAGRGIDPHLTGMTVLTAADERSQLISMNVMASLHRKVRALAAHRTQFAISPEMLAITPLWNAMAFEYFEPTSLVSSAASSAHHPMRIDPRAGARPLLTLPA
jgi:LmbE family N-acetylglucosaminyl deacetylase